MLLIAQLMWYTYSPFTRALLHNRAEPNQAEPWYISELARIQTASWEIVCGRCLCLARRTHATQRHPQLHNYGVSCMVMDCEQAARVLFSLALQQSTTAVRTVSRGRLLWSGQFLNLCVNTVFTLQRNEAQRLVFLPRHFGTTEHASTSCWLRLAFTRHNRTVLARQSEGAKPARFGSARLTSARVQTRPHNRTEPCWHGYKRSCERAIMSHALRAVKIQVWALTTTMTLKRWAYLEFKTTNKPCRSWTTCPSLFSCASSYECFFCRSMMYVLSLGLKL